MKRHSGTFLDEEEYQSVVVATVNGDAVEVFLEVVRVSRTLDSKFVKGNAIHLLYQFLAARIMPCMI